MSFALKEARFWKHIEGMAVPPLSLKAKTDNGEDQIKKIYAQEKKICEFKDNACKAIAKIR